MAEPLDFEQFKELRARGLSSEQIMRFENEYDKKPVPQPTNVVLKTAEKLTDYAFPQWLTNAEFERDKFNIWGDVGERSSAFLRAPFQGKNPLQGFLKPSTVPSTAEYMYLNDNIQPTGNKTKDIFNVAPYALLGEGIDMALNPFSYIGGWMSKNKFLKSETGKAIGKAQQIAGPIAKTVSPLVEKGIKNIRLTLGTPMRNFRKFQARQAYTADDLRNLPLKDRVTAQMQKSNARALLGRNKLETQSDVIAEEIGSTRRKGGIFEELGKTVKFDIGEKRKLLKVQMNDKVLLQKMNDREAINVLQANIKDIDDELTKVVNEGAEDIQPLLKSWFKANGTAYGARRDEYIELLKNSNKPFTVKDADDILGKTIDKLDEMNIIDGKGRMMIQKLKSEYNAFNGAKEQIKGWGDKLDFDKFQIQIRDVFHSVSGTLKSGTKVTEDDLAAIVLDEHFGNYLAENVPGFSELQQAYKPVIEAMKTLGTSFKPYASEFKKTSGPGFLKRTANMAAKGISTPESKSLELAEKGTEFASGIGKVSEKPFELAKKSLTAKEGLKTLKITQTSHVDKMMSEFNDKFGNLNEAERQVNNMLIQHSMDLNDKIADLQKGKMTIEKSIQLTQLNKELRQLQLAERQLRVKKLLSIQKRATLIKTAIASSLAIPTGIPQMILRSIFSGNRLTNIQERY